MEQIEVYVEICREGVELPSYAKPGDAGMDVRAAEDILIAPGETKIVPTGLKVAIPVGYEIQVRPRSGASFKTPLRVANAPGTVDSGYRDEVGIILNNTSNVSPDNTIYSIDEKGNKPGHYQIKKGDRIAQLVLGKVPSMKLTVVDSVADIGENRGGGFGHTGVK